MKTVMHPRTHSMIAKNTTHQMIVRGKLPRGGNQSGSFMKRFFFSAAVSALVLTPSLAAAQSDRVIGNLANTPIGSIRPETVLVNRDGTAFTGGGGGGSGTGVNDLYSAGNALPATLNSTYVVSLGTGQATTGFSIVGLTASGAVLTIEYTNDKGSTWAPIRYISNDVQTGATTLTADGQYTVPSSGHTQLRLRVSTAGTGTITVTSNASVAPKQVILGGNVSLYGQNGTGAATTSNPVPVNNAQIAGTTVSTGGGAVDAGTQRVVQAGPYDAAFPTSAAAMSSGVTYNAATGTTAGMGAGSSIDFDMTGYAYATITPSSSININALEYDSVGVPGGATGTASWSVNNLGQLAPTAGGNLVTSAGNAAVAYPKGRFLRIITVNAPTGGAITVVLHKTPIVTPQTFIGGGTVTVSSAVISSGYTGYDETTTPLGASATFTGTTRALVAGAQTFGARARADQAGTINLYQNGVLCATAPVTANTSVDQECVLRGTGSVRADFVNTTATAQTSFSFASSQRVANK